jgi:hypothetical protein
LHCSRIPENYTEPLIHRDSKEAVVKRLPASLFFAVTFIFCATLFADDTLPGLKPDRFSLSGYGSFVNTRVVHFKYKGTDNPPEWFSNVVLNLVMNMKFSEHFTGHIGIEGYTYQNTVPYGSYYIQKDYQFMYWTMYPHQIEGDYSFGDKTVFGGEVGVGLFPYKYNPDAWNLGEYLFRSGTYPGYLITNFDQAWPRLTGIRLSTTAFGTWHNDLLLTKEMEMPPYGDGTITWISDISFLHAIDIGAGVSFSHYLSVNENLTTPKNQLADTGKIDTISHDTTWYTFKGIKTMFRLSIDPKGFFEGSSIASLFGKEDLKIYGEVAILGLQNYDTCYSKLSERMPVMFGFNFPAFKLLDVLSGQLEYYGSPYPNDYEIILPSQGLSSTPGGIAAPVRFAQRGTYTMDVYRHDNWKWSIYANRFFGKEKHFGIIAQAARDHWRTYTTYQNQRDYEEALTTTKQWYWATKAVVIF